MKKHLAFSSPNKKLKQCPFLNSTKHTASPTPQSNLWTFKQLIPNPKHIGVLGPCIFKAGRAGKPTKEGFLQSLLQLSRQSPNTVIWPTMGIALVTDKEVATKILDKNGSEFSTRTVFSAIDDIAPNSLLTAPTEIWKAKRHKLKSFISEIPDVDLDPLAKSILNNQLQILQHQTESVSTVDSFKFSEAVSRQFILHSFFACSVQESAAFIARHEKRIETAGAKIFELVESSMVIKDPAYHQHIYALQNDLLPFAVDLVKTGSKKDQESWAHHLLHINLLPHLQDQSDALQKEILSGLLNNIDKFQSNSPAPFQLTLKDNTAFHVTEDITKSMSHGLLELSFLATVGTLSTASLLQSVLLTVLGNPDYQQTIKEELQDKTESPRLWQVIFECLRVYPPTQKQATHCAKACTIKTSTQTHHFSPGQLIILDIAAINRHSAHPNPFYDTQNPSHFNPDRHHNPKKNIRSRLRELLTFSTAKRNCPGQGYAINEVYYLLKHLMLNEHPLQIIEHERKESDAELREFLYKREGVSLA